MTWQITYRKNNELIDMQWVSPAGWGPAAIRKCFAQQFPSAEIISLEAQL